MIQQHFSLVDLAANQAERANLSFAISCKMWWYQRGTALEEIERKICGIHNGKDLMFRTF
jgi:hypothetical protein